MSSETQGQDVSILDENLNPNEIFKRMVINDKEQNKRLSALSANGSSKLSNNNVNNKTNIRYYICALGLLALTTSQMSRMILNQSIPVMVDPAMTSKQGNDVSKDGSCPSENAELIRTTISLPISTFQNDETTTTIAYKTSTVYVNESTTIEMIDSLIKDKKDEPDQKEQVITTTKLSSITVNNENVKIEKIELRETFMWNNDRRTTILGGFYYGYFLFMIPGGRLAEAYGSKYVLLVSVAGSAIINLATPWMARNSFFLLVSSRVLLGAIQSGVFPGMYALFSSWLTMSEASIFAPLIKMNLRLGMMFGSGLCGFMEYDWPGTFYTTGIICSIWSLLWLLLATSNPEDNRLVSKAELAHINKKKRKQPSKLKETINGGSNNTDTELTAIDKKQPAEKPNNEELETRPTPWLKILTSPSVIGLIIVKLTFNYAVDFLIILLPSYLANVHHAGPKTIRNITTPMFAVQVLLVVFVGWLATYIIKKRPYNLSKTAIRKIFQGISNGGMGLFIILLTFNDCNLMYVAFLLQIISFLSMFTAGGETVLPYDLSDTYPATIMAIANSIANLSGVTTTEISRRVLGNQPGSYYRWNILLYLVAGACIFGCIVFSILVKAEPINFDKKPRKKEIDLEEAKKVESKPTNGNSSVPEVKIKPKTSVKKELKFNINEDEKTSAGTDNSLESKESTDVVLEPEAKNSMEKGENSKELKETVESDNTSL